MGCSRATTRRRGKSHRRAYLSVPSHRSHSHPFKVSEAAKRALAELRKSRPDVDESNLKVDIPVAKAPPRPGAAPHHAAHMIMGMGGGAGMGMGVGVGMGMGAGMVVPNGMGVGANQFRFGAGMPHPFDARGYAAPPRPGMDLPAHPREAAIPQPAVPLALARGRRMPRAQAQAQAVVAAGGAGGQRKSR